MKPLQELADDWPRLSRLLDEALELEPAQRAGWLSGLPPEHAALRDTLARLLQAGGEVETGDFLRTLPPLPVAAPGVDAPAPGARVGPWRLLRELGRGGMGQVFLAERADGALKRQVALKLPRLTWADDLARRLARERDLLATLEHPHIARLYDAGVDEAGRPWLAIEVVQGQPLDRHATALGLSLDQRLALLEQVCAAVAYAHGRLVVHGDLKPANILVTPEGQVRLLDFGVARLVEAEGTEAGAVSTLLGRGLTPDYASPEQRRGERLTTASDVYSLGVVAFELLAGRRPAVPAVGEADGDEPPRASEVASDPVLRRALRGDADAVLAQALQSDPARRHANVDALAQELGRLRRGEPVAARRDNRWRRWRHRAWRRRVPLGLAAGVALALLGGAFAQAAVALALAGGFALAWWQRDRARQEAAAAREALRHAERQAERAERAKRFALSLLEGADPDAGAGAATTALELLQRARGEIEAELGGDIEAATEMRTAVGRALLGLGQVEPAHELLRATADEAVRSLGPDSALAQRARLHEAEALIARQQVDAALALIQPISRRTRTSPERAAEHALACRLEALALLDGGRGDEAVEAAERAVAAAAQLPGREGAVARLAALSERVNVRMTTGRPSSAEAVEALAAAEALHGARRPRPAPMLAAREALALARVREGFAAEALAVLRDMPGDWAALLGARHQRVATTWNLLGNAQLSLGDEMAALQAFEQSVAVSRACHGAVSRSTGLELTMVGGCLLKLRRDDDAAVVLAEAVTVLVAAAGDDHARTTYAREMLAVALARSHRIADAWAALEACRPSALFAFDAARHGLRRAQVQLAAGQADAGLHDLQAMIAACPQLPPDIQALVRLTEGELFAARGYPTEAAAALAAAESLVATRWVPHSVVLAEIRRRRAELESGLPAPQSPVACG
jgi:serine/threonine-protein kinase